MATPTISPCSTQTELNANLSDEKNKIKKREHPTFILSKNKKYKNLVHCYLCEVEDCQKLFNTNMELIEHKKSHMDLHTCPIVGCNKSFKDIVNLRKHYKHHFPTEKRYYCPFEGCDKSFTASYNLAIHYRIHIGKKPYQCEKCGKCFFDRANYKYHKTSKHSNINMTKLICQHKNCNHKSKSIKQKLMHHDKLEEFCINEKNKLLNLLMNFKKCSIDLLRYKLNSVNEENKKEISNDNNVISRNNIEDNALKSDAKKIISNYHDEELEIALNNIILQSKLLFKKAINQDQYQDICEEI